jgi:hypothetical protein
VTSSTEVVITFQVICAKSNSSKVVQFLAHTVAVTTRHTNRQVSIVAVTLDARVGPLDAGAACVCGYCS